MSPFQQITITKHKIPNILMIDESSFFFPYLKKKPITDQVNCKQKKSQLLKRSKVLQQERVIQRVSFYRSKRINSYMPGK